MGIIDELKIKAKERQHDAGVDNESVIQFTRAGLIAQLQKIHHFLHELVEQLYVAEPDIRVSLPIRDIGTCHNLQQRQYRLLAESKHHTEVISLMCVLHCEQPCLLDIKEPQLFNELQDKLTDLGVQTDRVTAPNGATQLQIKGSIPCKFIFEVDPEEALIRIRIHNFSQLGFSHYLLKADQINDDLLETLGSYLLRKDEQLLTLLRENTSGIHSAVNEDTFSPKTEEMDTSRMNSLFNRDAKLYLTYHNTIKELGSDTLDFIIGRSRDCDIVIKSDLASRQHACLLYRRGKFVLIDKSTNGTFIKAQGGKEIYVQREEVPLSGSGFISLGKSVSVDNEHLIYYSCQ